MLRGGSQEWESERLTAVDAGNKLARSPYTLSLVLRLHRQVQEGVGTASVPVGNYYRYWETVVRFTRPAGNGTSPVEC